MALVSIAKVRFLHCIPRLEEDSNSSHIKKAARRSWIAGFHYCSYLKYPFGVVFEGITD